MAALATAWAARLTFNFARRGGFNPKEEDYRWEHVRSVILKNNKPMQLLFSFGFVSLFQNLLLLGIASPALLAANNQTARPGLGLLDVVATSVFTIALAGETIADNRQYKFQEAKKAAIAAKRPLTPEQQQGFLSSGMWRYTRHPNYLCELTMWFAFHLFGIAASGLVFNITLIAPFALVFVVVNATDLAESMTSKKYPLYKIYQLAVGRIFPTMPHCDPRLCSNDTDHPKEL